MKAKLQDSVSNLRRANESLHEALAFNPRSKIIVAAIIKNFEFNYELSWKAFKRLLEYHGIQVNSPRQAIAEAYRKNFINGDVIWLKIIEDRNLTVHTYDLKLAEIMATRIEQQYMIAFDEGLSRLEEEVRSL